MRFAIKYIRRFARYTNNYQNLLYFQIKKLCNTLGYLLFRIKILNAVQGNTITLQFYNKNGHYFFNQFIVIRAG